MLRFGLLLLVAMAYGQRPAPLHTACHCNRLGINEETVVNQVVDILDIDHNGEIMIGEIVVGINRIIGGTLPVSEATILGMNKDALIALADLFNVNVKKADFVNAWIANFHDCPSFVEAVFDAFDYNMSGTLTARELEGIYDHARLIAGNYDNHLTTLEMHDFFMWIYQVC